MFDVHCCTAYQKEAQQLLQWSLYMRGCGESSRSRSSPSPCGMFCIKGPKSKKRGRMNDGVGSTRRILCTTSLKLYQQRMFTKSHRCGMYHILFRYMSICLRFDFVQCVTCFCDCQVCCESLVAATILL